MMADPTPRQLEAMRSIFNGRSIADRRDSADPFAKSYSSSMGGALRRMRETMGENGWLIEKSLKSGRTYFEEKLTAAGLLKLAEHCPDLPEIDARIAERRSVESDERIAEEAERERNRQIISAACAASDRNRIAALREIAQKYQVRLDLTDDQCLAMWMEIVDIEMEN